MGEEKVNRRRHSFWSLFGVRSNYSAVLGNAGYTLIELLVVIAIVGVLAGILVTLIKPATQLKKARDTQRKSDLSRIQSAIEIYRADLSEYPCTPPGVGCMPSACNLSLIGGTPPSTYMNQVPCDPLSPLSTVYLYSANAPTLSTYCLRACLENIDDIERDEIKYGFNNPSNGITGCNFSPAQMADPNCSSANRRTYTVQNP